VRCSGSARGEKEGCGDRDNKIHAKMQTSKVHNEFSLKSTLYFLPFHSVFRLTANYPPPPLFDYILICPKDKLVFF